MLKLCFSTTQPFKKQAYTYKMCCIEYIQLDKHCSDKIYKPVNHIV